MIRASADMAPAGCFGFSVRAPLRLLYLREGGQEILELRESSVDEEQKGTLIYEWKPTPAHPLHARLYQDGPQFRFWVHAMGTFIIDPETFRISFPPASDLIHMEERLWGWPAIVCVLHRRELPMHAAAADINRASVLLGAPGRFGKSTLAAAFHQAGHRVLAEDLSCIRWDASPAIVPGPALLRIRQDMMQHFSLSGARVVRTDSERCSVAVDAGRRGTCDPVPLRAVVLLRESTNGVRLERVPFTEALPDLWSLSFHLPDPQSRASCFKAVVELARSVPTWNLFRPLRHEVLPEVVGRIIETCLAGDPRP